jgi:hypothetical protein
VVCTERWRYIRYANGNEELYDHAGDPREWKNLAANPALAAVLAEYRKWLPKHDAENVADMKKPRQTTNDSRP